MGFWTTVIGENDPIAVLYVDLEKVCGTRDQMAEVYDRRAMARD
jgi:hypothetical protein